MLKKKLISANDGPLNRVVLLLNTNYAPMDICSTRHAICLWYLRKIEIIESYNEYLHSANISIAAPCVIKLKEFVRYNNNDIIVSRRNLMMRDKHTCQYCGTRTGPLTIDHVIPRKKGGSDTWENLVIACIKCNLLKGNRTPEEAQMPLNKNPRKLNRIHHFQNYVNQHQAAWRPYLFMESF